MSARSTFLAFAAAIAAATGCSSGGPGGSTEPVSGSLGTSSAVGAPLPGAVARSSSPVFADDLAPEKATACTAHPQYNARRISTVVGQDLTDRRGAVADSNDACSFFGEGVRVRFVTQAARTPAAARFKCQTLAGPDAPATLGARSIAWTGADGVYAVHEGQCYLAQVFDRGSLDLAASLAVAQDVAWRQR